MLFAPRSLLPAYSRLFKNLKLAFYLFLTFDIRIPLNMTETQLAQVATLATAIANAANTQGGIETQIDQLNAQLTPLQGQLTTASAATSAAIAALNSYVANPS